MHRTALHMLYFLITINAEKKDYAFLMIHVGHGPQQAHSTKFISLFMVNSILSVEIKSLIEFVSKYIEIDFEPRTSLLSCAYLNFSVFGFYD